MAASWRVRVAIGAVVALALVARVELATHAPRAPIGGDPGVYDQIGVFIADGHGWTRDPRGRAPAAPTAPHPPPWPFVLRVTYALTDHEDRPDQAAVRGDPPAPAL